MAQVSPPPSSPANNEFFFPIDIGLIDRSTVFVCVPWSRCTVLPGGNPGRQTLAPAGSTRGGSGGDEWSEALREKTPLGGQRTVRAAT